MDLDEALIAAEPPILFHNLLNTFIWDVDGIDDWFEYVFVLNSNNQKLARILIIEKWFIFKWTSMKL